MESRSPIRAGIPRKEGKLFSYVGHLHHEGRSIDRLDINFGRLRASLEDGIACAADGYLEVEAEGAE